MDSEILFKDAVEVYKSVDFGPLEGARVFLTGATGLLGTHFLTSLCLLKEMGMKNVVFAHCHSAPADYTIEIARRGGISLTRDIPLGADVILHAAGYAQPAVFTSNPSETIKLNTTLTQDLLKMLSRDGKFLFVSSSEVYSGLNKQSARESDIGTTSPYHRRACYIEGKRCGEAICNAHRQSGVHAVSARLSLAYGPGTRKGDQRALSTFIEQALTLGKVDMKYKGQELRTFCYIRDAIRMLWLVALHGTQAVYNVGGHEQVRIAELAECVGKLARVPVTFPDKDDDTGAPESVCMDLSRIEFEFGKEKFVGLEDGLRSTIEWQKGLYL